MAITDGDTDYNLEVDFADPDGDGINSVSLSAPDGWSFGTTGNLVYSGTRIDYDETVGGNNVITMTASVTDEYGAESRTATITINVAQFVPANMRPVWHDPGLQKIVINEQTTFRLGGTNGLFSDPDNDDLVYSVFSTSHDIAVIGAPYTYTLDNTRDEFKLTGLELGTGYYVVLRAFDGSLGRTGRLRFDVVASTPATVRAPGLAASVEF